MKNLKVATLVLAAMLSTDVSAAKKKAKKAKQAETEKVDTIPMSDFSYAIGIAQTNGLKNYSHNAWASKRLSWPTSSKVSTSSQ